MNDIRVEKLTAIAELAKQMSKIADFIVQFQEVFHDLDNLNKFHKSRYENAAYFVKQALIELKHGLREIYGFNIVGK